MNPAVPRVMGAVLMTGHGGFDRLELRDDVPVPVPGVEEVLLRVGAAAVNNTDINTRVGWYASDVAGPTTMTGQVTAVSARSDVGWSGDVPAFPRIQGADACGHIVAVGRGVDEQRIGERVLVEPVFRDPLHPSFGAVYFGSEVDGGFAEYTVAPARHVHRVECHLSDVELASFPCSYSAAENMMTRAAVASGDSVLVTGASGGVGSAAVQLAKRRGARVIALAGAGKHAEVEVLGADGVVDRDVDLIDTFGRNAFDVVIDVVGGAGWSQLLDVLRPGGRYAVAGAIGGPLVKLDLRTLYLKDLRLLGCTVLEPEVFPHLVRYIEQGEIRPVVAATFPLEEIVAAQQQFLAKQHVGKIVLRCT